MNWRQHKKELLKDEGFKKVLREGEPEYQIARAMVRARIKYKLSQKELAKKMKTKQSVISRVENAQTTASVSFLKRFAEVFDIKLNISFQGI